jgi:16S rRNA (uracil1498-N3)-methyltransferase
MTVRFSVAAIADAMPLERDGQHYLRTVLRLALGDELVVFDGAGRQARARLAADRLELAGPVEVAPPPLPVTLVVALLKGEKMDLVVQKATELGATRIVPAASARSVVRLEPAREASRVERWRRIAVEAARQCGRADAPEVTPPAPLDQALAGSAAAARVLLHERAAAPLRSILPARTASVAVAVGPEGGFSPEEVEAAARAGWVIASFGDRVLRAETAAIAALAVVGHVVEVV